MHAKVCGAWFKEGGDQERTLMTAMDSMCQCDGEQEMFTKINCFVILNKSMNNEYHVYKQANHL